MRKGVTSLGSECWSVNLQRVHLVLRKRDVVPLLLLRPETSPLSKDGTQKGSGCG